MKPQVMIVFALLVMLCAHLWSKFHGHRMQSNGWHNSRVWECPDSVKTWDECQATGRWKGDAS